MQLFSNYYFCQSLPEENTEFCFSKWFVFLGAMNVENMPGQFAFLLWQKLLSALITINFQFKN